MPCLCSDSVHLFQVRIPAACAANLRHHAPMQGITPESGFEKGELQHHNAHLIIDAPCAWILPRGPPNPSFYAWILFGLENGECLGSRAHLC